VLSDALEELDKTYVVSIFGEDYTIWYSAEIICSVSANVIHYNNDIIAIHKGGFIYDDHGKILPEASMNIDFSILENQIPKLSSKASKIGWKIMGPAYITLPVQISDKDLLKSVEKINNEIGKYGLAAGNTIRDYIAKNIVKQILNTDSTINIQDAGKLGKIFTESVPVNKKKILVSEITNSTLVQEMFLVKNEAKIIKNILEPLESIIFDFAVLALKNVDSVLAKSSVDVIEVLKNRLKLEIKNIQESDDEKAHKILQASMKKIKNINNISSSIEGVVFTYKEKNYKLTGLFSPINQILGYSRYKR